MQLNLKDPEITAMVDRLAMLTGTSKTAAVREAVRVRLADVEATRRAEREAKLAHLHELTRQIHERLPKPLPTQSEMDGWFYDEDGLPR